MRFLDELSASRSFHKPILRLHPLRPALVLLLCVRLAAWSQAWKIPLLFLSTSLIFPNVMKGSTGALLCVSDFMLEPLVEGVCVCVCVRISPSDVHFHSVTVMFL